MADFEGDVSLNIETSEVEIKGKFKLSGEELDMVAGGANNEEASFAVADAGTDLISGTERR